MKTLMEYIASLQPCRSFADYVERGVITGQDTLKSLILSPRIWACDKEWVLLRLLPYLGVDMDIEISIGGNYYLGIYEHGEWIEYKYDVETFIALIYEMLENIEHDLAI